MHIHKYCRDWHSIWQETIGSFVYIINLLKDISIIRNNFQVEMPYCVTPYFFGGGGGGGGGEWGGLQKSKTYCFINQN